MPPRKAWMPGSSPGMTIPRLLLNCCMATIACAPLGSRGRPTHRRATSRRRVVPAWLRGGLDALEDAQLLGFELRLQLVLDRGEPGEEDRIALVDRHRR